MAGLAYPSTVVLVGINLIPLALVWTGRWDGFDLLLAYWWEGIVVAGMAVIKGAVARERGSASIQATFSLFDMPIAAYLTICVVMSSLYLLLISSLALVYDGNLNSLSRVFGPSLGQLFGWVGRELFEGGLIFYAVAQAGPHLYSFVADYLRRAEYLHVQEVFETALIRVSTMELAVLVFVLISLGARWFPLWVVVVIKMLLDGVLHSIERMLANPSEGKPPQYQP